MAAGLAHRTAGSMTSPRLMARAAVVGAVLSGLFLMHGTAAATGGCQGTAVMPAMQAMQASTAPGAGGHAVGALPGAGAVSGHPAPASATSGGAPTSPHGTLCVSTPPRGSLAGILAAAGVVVLALGARGADRPAGRGRPARAHAPPARALLACLCVSRT